MSRPTMTEHFTDTGETIVREMNDAELAQYEIDQRNAEETKPE